MQLPKNFGLIISVYACLERMHIFLWPSKEGYIISTGHNESVLRQAYSLLHLMIDLSEHRLLYITC